MGIGSNRDSDKRFCHVDILTLGSIFTGQNPGFSVTFRKVILGFRVCRLYNISLSGILDSQGIPENYGEVDHEKVSVGNGNDVSDRRCLCR